MSPLSYLGYSPRCTLWADIYTVNGRLYSFRIDLSLRLMESKNFECVNDADGFVALESDALDMLRFETSCGNLDVAVTDENPRNKLYVIARGIPG